MGLGHRGRHRMLHRTTVPCAGVEVSVSPSRQRSFSTRSAAAPPARRVGGGSKNMTGALPESQDGVTIQFESHSNELAAVLEYENDPDCLESSTMSPNHGCRWSTRRRTGGDYGCCTPPIFCVASPRRLLGSNARPSPISSAWRHGALHGSSTRAMAAGTVHPGEQYASQFGLRYGPARLGTLTRCTGVIWSSWKTIGVVVPRPSQTVRARPSSRWYAPTRVSRSLPCSVSRSRLERTTSTV